MSNYNYRELPKSLADYAGEILVGAEVINGTGEVKIVLRDADPETHPDAATVFLHLSWKEAQDLAETIYHAACDADWAKRRDRCVGDQKPEWRKRDVRMEIFRNGAETKVKLTHLPTGHVAHGETEEQAAAELKARLAAAVDET